MKRQGKGVNARRFADTKEGIEQARRQCMDPERWKLLCCGHPLGRYSQREQGIRDYR